MTLAVVVGLVLYHRRPQLEKKVLRMGLPERLAEEWQGAFPGGFALSLVTVPADLFDDAQEAFLEDPDSWHPRPSTAGRSFRAFGYSVSVSLRGASLVERSCCVPPEACPGGRI